MLTSCIGDIRSIPIFIISIDSDEPVFVDKYFQSVATDSMVIAARHNSRQNATAFARAFCGDSALEYNMDDPSRSILQSVAALLGGTVPHEQTNDPEYDRVIEVTNS